MKSDEELIRSFHGGDREACDLLMERYKSMVRAKAKKLFLMGGDHDDLIQEGMIGLYQAINDFDETKETTFSSFAQLCVTRQMQTAIEAGNRKKNRPLNTYISIDDETIEHLLEPDPEERLLWEEDVRDRLKRAAELLSPMEKKVIACYLQGMSYTEIAEYLGKSPKSVDNALTRIKQKLHV